MRTVDVLIAARGLITNESSYNKSTNTYSRGRTGGSVYKDQYGCETLRLYEAHCYCAIGAINAAVGSDAESTMCGISSRRGGLGDDYYGLSDEFYKLRGITKPTPAQRKAFSNARKYLKEAFRIITGNDDIIKVNDAHTTSHSVILECFDLAIKNAKRRHLNGKKYSSRTMPVCLA